MTYSIVARCAETGQFGIAVASRFFAVGALVPHIRGRAGAVATQAFVNPLWGIEGADRLAAGEAPEAILADLRARDAGQAQRQAHMIDAAGRIAGHTGAECVDWAGSSSGENVSVAGNMLAGPEVVAQARATFEAATGPLFERLMTAMEAAALRGVRVNVLLPEENNLRFVHWATRHMLGELIHWGVDIYYQPPPFAHTKLFVVDRRYAQVGSANLDPRSLRLNFELNAEIYDPSIAREMAADCERIRARSRPVTAEELAERAPAERLRDAAFWLASPYL